MTWSLKQIARRLWDQDAARKTPWVQAWVFWNPNPGGPPPPFPDLQQEPLSILICDFSNKPPTPACMALRRIRRTCHLYVAKTHAACYREKETQNAYRMAIRIRNDRCRSRLNFSFRKKQIHSNWIFHFWFRFPFPWPTNPILIIPWSGRTVSPRVSTWNSHKVHVDFESRPPSLQDHLVSSYESTHKRAKRIFFVERWCEPNTRVNSGPSQQNDSWWCLWLLGDVSRFEILLQIYYTYP